MNHPIKVLFYDPISRSGGGKAYIMNVITKIKKSSQFQYHYYINRCFEHQTELQNQSVQVHYSPKSTEKGGFFSFVKRYLFTKKEIDKIKPDIIIFMNQIPTKFKVPTILFLRNALYFLEKNKNYFGPISIKDRIRCAVLKKVTIDSIHKSDLVLTSSEVFSKTVMPYVPGGK